MEQFKELVATLNSISPLAVIAGLSYIIYQLAAKRGRVRTIAENHLSGLPDAEANIRSILDGQRRQEALLLDQTKALTEITTILRNRL